MGWSESYYRDMRAEGEEELRKRALPLLEALDEFRAAYSAYGGLFDDLEGLQDILEVLYSRLDIYRQRP